MAESNAGEKRRNNNREETDKGARRRKGVRTQALKVILFSQCKKWHLSP